MTGGPFPTILFYLRGLFREPPGSGQTDRQLLADYTLRHDEAAFTALVERHGPLVWGVCRRVLGHAHDVEDAFQATFLVLARKAAAIHWRDEIGNWLYAVALRVARKAKAQAERQRRLEREAASVRTEKGQPAPEEWGVLLDEEVARLPDKYRRPVILCCFQGKTYGEAAHLLGWPEGTVSGRLARARDMLRKRFTRRGLTLASAGLTAALVPEAVSAGAPAHLSHATVQTSMAFAAGQGVTTAPAALAEGVILTMFHAKAKISAAVLLALILIGTGVGVLARAYQAERPPAVRPDQPPAQGDPAVRVLLPKEWAGRWVADPFRGAESIEVLHAAAPGGEARRYQIKDAMVIAELLKKVKITGIQNNMHVGLIPTAQLTVRRKDGTTFQASVLGPDSLACSTGLFYLEKAFLEALGRQLGDDTNEPLDLLTFRAAPPQPKPDAPVPPSLRSLTTGFTSLEVEYSVGKRLHRVRITDPKTLAALHKTLTVLKLNQEKATPGQGAAHGLTIVSKDRSTFYGQILTSEELYQSDLGKIIVQPAFVKALAKEVSRLEGRDLGLLGDNAPTAEQVKREQEFSKLLADVVQLRFTRRGQGADEPFVIDQPQEVTKLVKVLAWAEVPIREARLAKGERFLELTTKAGKKFEIALLKTDADNEKAGPAPLLGDLVEVSGFGPVWIDNQWKYRFEESVQKVESAAREKETLKTTELVCRDLPTFFKQVLGVVANYREGESELMNRLGREESRRIVDLLAGAKWQPLDWKRERWDKELAALFDRGAGSFDLAPGLGFSLTVVVRGEKEMLIPMVGKLTFAESPVAKFQEAIDAVNAKSVTVLPREKGKK